MMFGYGGHSWDWQIIATKDGMVLFSGLMTWIVFSFFHSAERKSHQERHSEIISQVGLTSEGPAGRR